MNACGIHWNSYALLQTVKQNQIEYGLPLKILSYDELYGWTMDKIVSQIGKKNNCTSALGSVAVVCSSEDRHILWRV